ncbi:hypothetical protein [Rhizobium ruizarguesonis]|uniref:hypothetical protein n=1 Tax=Rhizobium ruizarguesonis TaxID=2081791 RepID=UPI00103203ED|nr:hypothetical protein [Rhizobium ruizarguesonis]TAY81989.1 hypothetical protein ELH86_24915 [Rhizobium ruizarguesonis]
MGRAKEHWMESESIDVKFACPTPECDEIVDAVVEPAYYDTSAENESDMAGYSKVNVACVGCKLEFTIEGHAHGAGTTYSVINHPSVEVVIV